MRPNTALGAIASLLLLSSLLGGSAAAAPAPTPAEIRLYLRYDDGAATQCGGRYLSQTDGPDGAGQDCQSQTAITTVVGQTSVQEWVADERAGLPIRLDASRNLTGEFTLETAFFGTDQGQPNSAELDVVARLNNTVLATARLSSGAYLGSQRKLTFSVDIPGSLHRVDVTSARIDVTWKRVVHAPGAYHASISMDNPASFFTLPSIAR